MAERVEAAQLERQSEPEWEITFTLAAGYDEKDAIELYEYIEGHRAVNGAALAGLTPANAGLVDYVEPEEVERV